MHQKPVPNAQWGHQSLYSLLFTLHQIQILCTNVAVPNAEWGHQTLYSALSMFCTIGALHQRYFAPKVNTLHHCCYEPEVHTLLPRVPHPPLVQTTTTISTRRSLLGFGTQCCYAHSHLAAEYMIASSILCPLFILKLYHNVLFPLTK